MSTPTFYHTSVLLQESVAALAIVPDGVYVDATFGGGGHSRAILAQLGPKGRLLAFDQDEDAWRNQIDDSRFTLIRENFRYLARFLRLEGLAGGVQGILADLGVSSWQFDTAERGFSTRFDGPLDMRMDQRMEKTAADILDTYTEERLHKLFEEAGEIRNSKQLARHIVEGRIAGKIKDTNSLKQRIAPVVKGNPQRYFAQLFQALRIEVNDEFGALKDFLSQSAQCLQPNGRLAVISFHSLEDRLVKTFMKRGVWKDEVNEFGQVTNPSLLTTVAKKPIEAGASELNANPRSRSAKLRIAQKL
ncbi:MAG: 16S rRNA (cytosine(1402)-N(4))-methyltransferase RsmH [Bacteroidetes bacterium]|nr:16S rRNA (cytosine(1402)-N(4))-methyltransferase RsmH [Bacteroidota bacterium]